MRPRGCHKQGGAVRRPRHSPVAKERASQMQHHNADRCQEVTGDAGSNRAKRRTLQQWPGGHAMPSGLSRPRSRPCSVNNICSRPLSRHTIAKARSSNNTISSDTETESVETGKDPPSKDESSPSAMEGRGQMAHQGQAIARQR